MSELTIYPEQAGEPILNTVDPARIQDELSLRGIAFDRCSTRAELAPDADQSEILSAYAEEIQRIQAQGDYPTVDAIRMHPDHPDREALRQKFLSEHTHAEDEVRLFIEGQGLFCLHINSEVLQVRCEANDWISVPAGTRHWFDMGEKPCFCAVRFFNNPSGWIATFTGDPIADRFPRIGGSPTNKVANSAPD